MVNASTLVMADLEFDSRKWLWNQHTRCSSNKMLSLSYKWHRHGSLVVMFMSAVPMVFGLALILANFILILVVAHFISWDHFFFTFFKFFPSLGVVVSIRVTVYLLC